MIATTFLAVSWDAVKASREGEPGIARRQAERLADLVSFAREHSPYLAQCYAHTPDRVEDIRRLPLSEKAALMAHFDDWVTDSCVTRQNVEAFIADPQLAGRDFLGRYVVCTTSGATGTPAILMHDHHALTVYNVLGYVRSLRTMMNPRFVTEMVRGRGHLAAVFVSGGHFLGSTMMARRHRAMPWRAKTQRLFSALLPEQQLVDGLNAFSPVILGGYPSVLELLARNQLAGKLHIHPILISAAGETLTDSARQRISAAFGCHVANYYGTSEAVGLTFECAGGHLHVNSDWYVLEPITGDGVSTGADEMSDDVLVTNLANRIQPIIRYRLGDRVAMNSDRCQCGSPFPCIRVEGRTDDILEFRGVHGQTVRIPPLALATIAEETPGVSRCQLVQTAPAILRVRMSCDESQDGSAVWDRLHARLRSYLGSQGIGALRIERASEGPQLHPGSGKFRQVFSLSEKPRS